MEKFFPKQKLIVTGNPVREDIASLDDKKEEGQTFFQLSKDTKTVLVLGGSLGSRAINELVEKCLLLFEKQGVQVLWQTGSFYFEKFKKNNAISNIQVHDFIYKMDFAYAVADVVISRAGALSVSELCMAGKPVIFIPSPNVAEDHQKKNALAIVKEDAAIMIEEKNLDNEFEKAFVDLISSEEKRKKLSLNIQKLAKPNATKAIADEVEKLLDLKTG